MSQTVNYGYDGEGKRVTKSIAGGATIAFVYDAQGQLTQEYGSPADSGTQYLTSDPLGSTRLVSTISGGVASAFNRSDYLPFGQEIPSTWNRSNYQLDTVQRIKFTAKERDSETGLDWFNTRYFSGAQGRFTSPDQPLNDQNPSDPQSWNLYSYVRNNPLKFTDPTGQDCVYTSGASDGTVGLQRGNCTEAGGTFVNGTIDEKSFAYDSKTNSIGYSYTNAAEGTAGAGSIALPDPEDAANRAGAAQIAGSQLIVNEFAKQALYGALGGIAGRAIGFGVEALLAARAARAAEVAVDVANLSNKIVRQMASRGWTAQEIVETVQGGKTSTVLNKATGGTATQYVNAATGKFVVVDNATKQVIQVSGPGFLPNPPIR